MTNKVVIYTPAQDFWYNNPDGGNLVIWFLALMVALSIANYLTENSRRGWKGWQVAGAVACMTYTLHYGAIWALTYL